MPHWLSVIKGNHVGKQFRLSEGQGTVGRGPSNSVQLFDGEVSRVHCRYSLVGGRLQIADLDSSNGTFVNDNLVEQSELRPGDRIQLGTTVLEYRKEKTSVAADDLDEVSTTERTMHPSSHGGQPSSLSYFPFDKNLVVDSPGEESFGAGKNEFARRMVQISSDLNFMYHASLATSSKANRDDMLERVVGLIFEWVAADRCCVLLRDGDKRTLDLKACKSRVDSGKQNKLLISQSIVNYVRKNRVGILTSNAVKDRRLSGQDSIKMIGICEAICVPIQGRTEMLGLIYVDALDTSGDVGNERFTEDNLKVMIAIAHQIAFAIENERYFSRLLEKERLATIGQTTTSLSHHIKNVLQGVHGGSHLIEEGLGNDNVELIRAGWKIVKRNQKEVNKLVNDMLIVGQPYQPNLVTSDLNIAIKKVLHEIAPHLEQMNVKYYWEPDRDIKAFRFDPRGMHWALFNVINSCAAACREVSHGEVRVWLDRAKDEIVVIKIADNGLPAQVDDPDDLFSLAKSELDHKMNPVELAVSRKLVRGHGGDITIEYPKSGGNLFSVRLPIEPLTAEKIEASSSR